MNPELSGLEFGRAAQAVNPPAPPPLLVRQLAPEDALSINRSIPIADLPNPAARPFAMGSADQATRARALECLTSAVYYEAGSESDDGQRAVAQVVLNRVRHPAFPASVCDVVYQGSTRVTGCQFTFTCDGSLARQPEHRRLGPGARVASAALAGAVYQAGRVRDPVPCRLRGSLLGLEPDQERGRRSAYLLSLGGRLGPSGPLHQALRGP